MNTKIIPGQCFFTKLNQAPYPNFETGKIGPEYILLCQGDKKKEKYFAIAYLNTLTKLDMIWENFSGVKHLTIDVIGGWKDSIYSKNLGDHLLQELKKLGLRATIHTDSMYEKKFNEYFSNIHINFNYPTGIFLDAPVNPDFEKQKELLPEKKSSDLQLIFV